MRVLNLIIGLSYLRAHHTDASNENGIRRAKEKIIYIDNDCPSGSSPPVILPPDCDSIPLIQGSSTESPCNGITVQNIKGVVTAISDRGFYMQDPVGDDDDTTSDAIYVFLGNGLANVNVGDLILVDGRITEFSDFPASARNQPLTEITAPSTTILSSNFPLPPPVIIGANKNYPPTGSIENGIEFFEALEGMRVEVKRPITTAGSSERFNETYVTDGAVQGTSPRGVLTIGPNDFNPERIKIRQDPSVREFSFPELDVGAHLSPIVGILSYSFGNYEVVPTETFRCKFKCSLEMGKTSFTSGEDDKLLVASFNVLNLDPNDNDGDEDIKNERFKSIARIIAENMGAPDVIALQEIQDSSGTDNNGIVDAELTLQKLVREIKKVDENLKYDYLDNTFIQDNASGGQPGANIRVCFLYNPSRVDLVGSPNALGYDDDHASNPENPFFNSRLPLAAKFVFLPTSYVFEVINVHFSSKGGSVSLVGTRQPIEQLQDRPSVNGGVDERLRQSQAIRDYVDKGNGLTRSNVIVTGDMNEYVFNPPLTNLEGTPMIHLNKNLPEEERYSYIFQGNAQTLDHAFVSEDLCEKAVMEHVHVVSEHADTKFRASDHDPLVVQILVDQVLE